MIIHFHYSLSPNSGDVKRISNIDREISEFYNDKTIEIVFCPLKKLKYVKGNGFFKLSENTIKKICIPLIPRQKVLNYLYESVVLTILGMVYRPKILIGEMFFPKFFGLFKSLNPKTILIADIHGAAVEENIYQNPSISEKKVEELREIDRNTVETAHYILCQSDEMKRYIHSNYQIKMNRIVTYRCGYDSTVFYIDEHKRLEKRDELKLTNEILFIYAGGMHKWQKIEESLKVFGNYHIENQNSRFLILTSEEEYLQIILSEECFSDIRDSVISFSVPFNSVSAYLNAADVAFLIRDNHVMNAVASPTKLAEYMACGLPVISSKVSESWINPEAKKFIIDFESVDVNKRINECLEIDKDKIQEYAIMNLSLDIDHRNIAEFFSSIKNN